MTAALGTRAHGPDRQRLAAAVGFELDVITAVILGGASLNGGRGTLAGTFVGLLLIGVINNGPTSRRCPPIGRAS